MPSANKTPNINLSQWAGNEYVKRQDFCDDNLIIDREVGELKTNLGNKETLTTSNKDSLVDAVNEMDKEVGDITTLTTTKKDNLVNAVNELDKELENFEIVTSKKSKKLDTVLTTSNWTGSQPPFLYTLEVTEATATNVIEIISKPDITAEQVSTFMDAIITPASQSAGNIALKAWGGKPAIDLPVTVIVRGDL